MISAALHLLFALSVLASASGEISRGLPAANYGDAVEISLSGFEGAPAPGAGATSPSELETLFQRIRAEQSDLNAQATPAERHSDLAALFSEIDQEHSPTQGNATGRAQADARGRAGSGSDASGSEAQGGDTSAAARNGERQQETASEAIWDQIEPCWRQMPENSTVPVTLEFVLNGRGALAAPPRIIRPMAAALTDQRLVAEARALAAVTACMPLRTLGRSRSRTLRIVFLPTREPDAR